MCEKKTEKKQLEVLVIYRQLPVSSLSLSLSLSISQSIGLEYDLDLLLFFFTDFSKLIFRAILCFIKAFFSWHNLVRSSIAEKLSHGWFSI
jgi:hypothetical protein